MAHALDGVEDLEPELRARGLNVPMLLLHSGGGAITVGDARRGPLGLASSGPAAGTVAAGELTAVVRCVDALCCDVGGTSFDVSVVREGLPERRQQANVNGLETGVSSVDVESIGAGGGSMAWIDSRGTLRVGPRSARAIPGPVCYGRGGTVPTVTDSNLLLGYISPGSFQSGGIELDTCASLGEQIGLSAMETAFGIREIAIAEMAKAIRARMATSGLDPRELSLISIGGSGSLLVPTIARGDLIVGGGHVEAHFRTGVNGVHAILDTHGETIAPGDLFLVNDPYTGGGFHAQDVFVHQPVFHGEELVAWVGTSAHMMCMGGGVPGSFVPTATECY